jgi:SPP1 family predicted phage head-tail adaptor
MSARPLDRRIVIEMPVAAVDPDYGTQVISWTPLATIWANVLDDAPGQNEELKQNLVISKRRGNVRYRYRTDVTSAMRFRVPGPVERILQIVSPPAEIGRHEFSEVKTEEISS